MLLVTAITPRQICSPHRCAMMQHQSNPALLVPSLPAELQKSAAAGIITHLKLTESVESVGCLS
jgi:hypothetical protein